MKFCAARPTLAVCWRSASTQRRLRRFDHARQRSATRVCRSARSIAADRLAGLDAAALGDRQRRAGCRRALARMIAVRGATSGPGELDRHRQPREHRARRTSDVTNSSDRCLSLPLLAAEIPAFDSAASASPVHDQRADDPQPDPAPRLVSGGASWIEICHVA